MRDTDAAVCRFVFLRWCFAVPVMCGWPVGRWLSISGSDIY
ncbi:MAG: hypothetical protein ACO3PX_10900 [bacterium]